MGYETLLELGGLAVLNAAGIVAIAMPPRMNEAFRGPSEVARFWPGWAARHIADWPWYVVRVVLGFGLLVAASVWVGARFLDNLAIVTAMLLELSGVLLLAIEVWTGHEAERYDAPMTRVLEVLRLREISDWAFIVNARSLIPGALERANVLIARAERQGGTTLPGLRLNMALDRAKATKVGLGTIDAAAGLFESIGTRHSPSDLKEAANSVHERLKDTFVEATEWREHQKDQVFTLRRIRLAGGVLLLILAGIVHAWHLMAS